MFSGVSALHNLTDFNTGLWDVYMHFLPDICSIGTCFETTDTVDWLEEKCENGKSEDGINCEISLTSEVSS